MALSWMTLLIAEIVSLNEALCRCRYCPRLKLSLILYDLASFSPNLVAMPTSPGPSLSKISFFNSLAHISLFTLQHLQHCDERKLSYP